MDVSGGTKKCDSVSSYLGPVVVQVFHKTEPEWDSGTGITGSYPTKQEYESGKAHKGVLFICLFCDITETYKEKLVFLMFLSECHTIHPGFPDSASGLKKKKEIQLPMQEMQEK